MARLNIKSTKAAFVKELQDLQKDTQDPEKFQMATFAIKRILRVAKELEIEIKPEEYR